MPNLTVTDATGASKTVVGRDSGSLMEAIRDADFDDFLAICGGACACATCHVYIDDPAALDLLAPMGSDEAGMLDALDERRPTSRLSCQVPLNASLEGLRVTIAPGG